MQLEFTITEIDGEFWTYVKRGAKPVLVPQGHTSSAEAAKDRADAYRKRFTFDDPHLSSGPVFPWTRITWTAREANGRSNGFLGHADFYIGG